MDGHLRIVTLPEDDPDFARAVNDAVAKLRNGSGADRHEARVLMIELVQRLLPLYPALDVRQQDELASFESDPRTWYVYRDGSSHRR